MKDFAPIILFVYNRPEHTRKVVEGLLSNPEASNSELFIFADGPKSSISKDGLEKLNNVREYIHSISGFKKIYIDESDTNRGLANATIRGCSMIINKYGRMIVMEDDDVPNQFFLSYMNRCLNKFENDDKIWCVSGYTNTSILHPQKGDDLFFVNRPSSWGFGTWKRCWDKVIWDINILKGIFKHKGISKGFNQWGGIDSSLTMKRLFDGRNSSWSVRYNFMAYLCNAVTILPNKSLIKNIGCDGTGTHCGNVAFNIEMMEREILIPEIIKFDAQRNRQLRNSFKLKWIDIWNFVRKRKWNIRIIVNRINEEINNW